MPLIALLSGLLFGAGLNLSRMTDPLVVLGFLDVAGDWNPALAFVMAGVFDPDRDRFRAKPAHAPPRHGRSFRHPRPCKD